MMIDKKEIEFRFKQSATTYNDNAIVQKRIVAHLIKLIKEYINYTPENILEIGCGTGLLTNELYRTYQTNIYLNDLVKEVCFSTASHFKVHEKHTLAGDIEHISLPQIFDLIVSASTFQWFAEPQQTYNKLAASLKEEGILIFNTFGENNLKELKEITGCSLDYINKEEIEKLVSPYFNILHIEESLDTIYFKNPLDVLKHLKKTGVNSLSKNWVWTKGSLNRFTEEYTTRFSVNHTFPLTYHPIYLVCRKKIKS